MNREIEEQMDEVCASAVAMKILCQMSPDLKCMAKVVDEHCQKVKKLRTVLEREDTNYDHFIGRA